METEGEPVIPLSLEDDEVGYEDMEDVRVSESDSDGDDDDDTLGVAQPGRNLSYMAMTIPFIVGNVNNVCSIYPSIFQKFNLPLDLNLYVTELKQPH